MTTLAVPTDVFVVYTCLLLDHSGMLLLKNEVQSSPSSGEDSGLFWDDMPHWLVDSHWWSKKTSKF